MPRGRPKNKRSQETFGAECCKQPHFLRYSRYVHPSGPVYRCLSERHKERFFVVPSPTGAFQVTLAELKRKENEGKAPANPRGRPSKVPPGKRALLPIERHAVKLAIEAPGDDEEERTSHRSATLAEDGAWLSDKALDEALELICAGGENEAPWCVTLGCHFYNLLTREGYNYAAVQRWTRTARQLELFDPTQVRKLLAPVNIGGNHWVLVIVDFSARRITYMDSMLPRGAKARINRARPVLSTLQRYIKDEWMDKVGGADAPTFSTVIDETAPQQGNGYDCGVFTLAYCEAIVQGKPVASVADQRYMRYLRQRYAAAIEYKSKK